jgi:hypothetical protein
MFNTILGAGAGAVGAGAGAAERYGSGSDQMIRLLAAPAPQHCFLQNISARNFLGTFIKVRIRIRTS